MNEATRIEGWPEGEAFRYPATLQEAIDRLAKARADLAVFTAIAQSRAGTSESRDALLFAVPNYERELFMIETGLRALRPA